MALVFTSATFGSEDPEALVAAGLACQFCLRATAALRLTQDAEGGEGGEGGVGGEAWCQCRWCGGSTLVRLSPDQLRRIALAPPLGAAVFVD